MVWNILSLKVIIFFWVRIQFYQPCTSMFAIFWSKVCWKAMRLEHHCINLFMGIDITMTLLTRNLVFTDLSSIPNVSSVNEEPENLEVKSLTPTEPFSPEPEDRQDYSQSESSPEPRPSTFSFPSEDEPVTMISKSIPSFCDVNIYEIP